MDLRDYDIINDENEKDVINKDMKKRKQIKSFIGNIKLPHIQRKSVIGIK